MLLVGIIPAFRHCGLSTLLLNLTIPGLGNTLNLTLGQLQLGRRPRQGLSTILPTFCRRRIRWWAAAASVNG
jgi:hypothetical protein